MPMFLFSMSCPAAGAACNAFETLQGWAYGHVYFQVDGSRLHWLAYFAQLGERSIVMNASVCLNIYPQYLRNTRSNMSKF